ncbi:MAG TPA: AI-2E family transporter, partial [Anaerolineales bacterium]|nr:AI-2E family transporter [Anaerolineales bacterium]
MIKIIRYTIVVVTTLMLLLLLWQFSSAIMLFLLSLAVAAALRPLINSLTERRVPKWLALGIVYFLLVAVIVSFLLLISQPLFDELQKATNDFIANYDRAKAEWPLRGTLFQQTLAERLPPSAELYQALTNENAIPALTSFFGIAQNFLSNLGQITIVIVLSLYWSADQFRFERLGLSLLPKEYHPRALHIWRSIENEVGAYLRSEIVQSVLTGLLLWLGYSVL